MGTFKPGDRINVLTFDKGTVLAAAVVTLVTPVEDSRQGKYQMVCLMKKSTGFQVETARLNASRTKDVNDYVSHATGDDANLPVYLEIEAEIRRIHREQTCLICDADLSIITGTMGVMVFKAGPEVTSSLICVPCNSTHHNVWDVDTYNRRFAAWQERLSEREGTVTTTEKG